MTRANSARRAPEAIAFEKAHSALSEIERAHKAIRRAVQARDYAEQKRALLATENYLARALLLVRGKL